MFEVFRVFLVLGLTSFGGPSAHIGFFHEAFVVRRRWLGQQAFGELLALCQFLPGPASSQLGMGIGLHRAGMRGLVAAWLGFTLPSAVLMAAFAVGAPAISAALGTGWLVGLGAAAVAIVVHAVFGMARTFAPDGFGFLLAALTLLCTIAFPHPFVPAIAILLAGVAGAYRTDRSRGTNRSAISGPGAETSADPRPPIVPTPDDAPLRIRLRTRTAVAALALFFGLLLGLPLLAASSGGGVLTGVDSTYRAGALVFGGGHVVLPALQSAFVDTGAISPSSFFAGYGAAQAMPGPLFTFASYLGAEGAIPPGGAVSAAIATVVIFLPGVLLLVGVLPFWTRVRGFAVAHRALHGINAAVVGLLAAALVGAIAASWFPEGAPRPTAIVLSLLALAAITARRVPPWAVVLASGAIGALADAAARGLAG